MSKSVGVFQILEREHREVSAPLDQVAADPKLRPALWPTIRAQLVSHEMGEMSEVYPALRQVGQDIQVANAHDVDAGELRATIERLHTTPYDAAQWATYFDALVAMVRRHVEEEESTIFPRAQAALGEARSVELERTFLDCRSKIVAQL